MSEACVDGSPVARFFLEGGCSSAGADMCTAFAVLLTAALMRSTDRLPIIRVGMMPEPLAGFSGLAEP